MFSRLDVLGFWQRCSLERLETELAAAAATSVLKYKPLYDAVQAQTGVPWYVVGAIDYREEGFEHNAYLGNGDPLNRPTRHVPRGRGPFASWQDGAIDAIHVSGWDRLPAGGHWDIVTALMKCEVYNGMGYAHMGLRSPYVWGGTSMQQRGKYTSDGHFDPSAWDTQLGVAAIFLALKQFHGVDLSEA
jgi:lysozyme family protein